MNIVPKDTTYIPLTQQRWCCVPACIQMIMLRHNIPLVPAELMGYYFKLIVPLADKKYFWHPVSGTRPKAGYGTQIYEKNAANGMFKKLGIPLNMEWHLIDEFSEIDAYIDYLKRRMSAHADTLVCFDWGTLFHSKIHTGHVCVLDKIDLRKNELRIIDPEYFAPKWRTVPIAQLYDAMEYHGKENSAGFWELSTTK